MWNFIFLFELDKLGAWSEIAEFRKRASSIDLNAIENNQFCSVKYDSNQIQTCKWKEYAAWLKLEVGVSNYDEGYRCYVKRVRFDDQDWSKSVPKCAQFKPAKVHLNEGTEAPTFDY